MDSKYIFPDMPNFDRRWEARGIVVDPRTRANWQCVATVEARERPLLEITGDIAFADFLDGDLPFLHGTFAAPHGDFTAIGWQLSRIGAMSSASKLATVVGSLSTLLVGAHINPSEYRCQHIIVELDMLGEWMGIPMFDQEYKDVFLTAHTKRYAPTILCSADSGYTIEHRAYYRHESNYYYGSLIAYRHVLRIARREGFALTEITHDIFLLQQLFWLLTGFAFGVRSVQLVNESDPCDRQRLDYLYAPVRAVHLDHLHEIDLFLRYGAIKDTLGSLMNNWLASRALLDDSLTLFASLALQATGSIKFDFLAATQATESLYRNTVGTGYMNASEYPVACAPLIESIPSSFSTAHRQSLTSRIKYGNELSLRNKVLKIVSTMPDPLRQYFGQSPKTIVDRIVRTRNEITHLSGESANAILGPQQMYFAKKWLEWLCRFHMLLYLGMDPTALEARFRGYWRNRDLARATTALEAIE